MTRARTSRGRRTQVVVAMWLQKRGHPNAGSPWGSMPGKDITGVPGHSIEIKARSDFDPMAWWKQAKKNSEPGDTPEVIVRLNGSGDSDEAVGNYLIFRLLKDDELGAPARQEEIDSAVADAHEKWIHEFHHHAQYAPQCRLCEAERLNPGT